MCPHLFLHLWDLFVSAASELANLNIKKTVKPLAVVNNFIHIMSK